MLSVDINSSNWLTFFSEMFDFFLLLKMFDEFHEKDKIQSQKWLYNEYK